MNSVRRCFLVFSYTNCIIALAAVAQCLLTYIIVDLRIQPYILIIEGASTLLLYNFSLFLSKPVNPKSSPYPRTRFFFKHEPMMRTVSTLALFSLLYAVSQVHTWTIIFLGYIGILSLLYNAPVLPGGNSKGGVRQLPGLKLFYIAVLWSLSTVGLPVIEAWSEGHPIQWSIASYLGAVKTLFLITCTLPFDIRDMKQDRHYGLKTLPLMIGKQYAVCLNYILLLIHTTLVLIAPYDLSVKGGLMVTNCLVFGILKYVFDVKESHHNPVYLLDTALVFQCLITIFISWLYP